MKIIHTADLHLDSKMESNLSAEAAGTRRIELLDTFSRLVEFADTGGVRVILIAGDMFDKAHIRKSARRRILDEITSHPDIDFLYLRGNHDKSDFLADIDESDIPSNLKGFSESEWTAYKYDNIVISGRELSDLNYKNIAVNLILDESDINIVTVHGQESDYVGTDKTHTIELPAFKGKFIDYLALGHVHTYKHDKLDDRGEYCYCGCLEGRGFDECGKKGFVLLDIDEELGSIERTFVPFAKRTLWDIHVEVTEDMNMPAIIKVVDEALQKVCNGDLVKVVLDGTIEMDFDVDTDRIVSVLGERFFFMKVYDETSVKIDYANFAGDKSLKGEFVQMMQKADMSEERRAAIIDLGMKALLGEELL